MTIKYLYSQFKWGPKYLFPHSQDSTLQGLIPWYFLEVKKVRKQVHDYPQKLSGIGAWYSDTAS